MPKRIYDPKSDKPFKLSRSKIDLFLKCPRCFYLDQRLGVKRPKGFPFNLNSEVDRLLKMEFDIYRKRRVKHPLQKEYKIKARPIPHRDLDKWRENFVGIQYLYKKYNFIITGAIDDLWKGSDGKYIVVDYKATAKKDRIKELDKDWQEGYKRQMEVYQWLLRKKGLSVSSTGYFVYCNGKKLDAKAFDKQLEFEVTVIPYKGSAAWVSGTVEKIYKTLRSSRIPKSSDECEYCEYCGQVNKLVD